MSITGNSNIEYRKDEKTRYVEEDNIKDITKDDLKKLKSTLKTDEETDLDSKLTKINDDVEKIFNGYISGKDDREKTITYTTDKGTIVTDTPKNIIMSEEKDVAIKKDKLDGLANYIIDLTGYEQNLNLIKEAEIKEILKEYKFELKDLRKEISVSTNTGSGDKTDNPFLYDENGSGGGEKKEGYEGTKEGYEGTKDYIDGYGNFSYANVGDDRNIENIYRDKDVRKSLERILDNEENKELHKGTFNINLGVEEGLAGIIIKIREAIAEGEKDDPDVESNAYKLYEQLTGNSNLIQDGESYNLTFDRKAIKDLIDLGLITYDRKGGWDNELKKIAKILSQAQRADLDTFASLLQSKPDITMAVKEWNNALEMTGNNRENIEQTSLIDETNVLEFLCDFNSDGQISAEYKRKFNKKQENQGDVGTLFGQQVLFTIEQAINTKNVELGEPQGEQLVISNIVKNMIISDSRTTGNQRLLLDEMSTDSKYCTRENLAKLMNGSEEDGLSAMPELKILFLDSIKKINGGSNEVTPDLSDTLTGNETKSIIDLVEDEVKLKQAIDDILEKSTDPQIIEAIRLQGLVRVRQTIFTQIMTVLDNVEITTNDGKNTSTLQAAGITKGRETRQLKKELLETAIETLIKSGIHRSTTGGLLISIGYGKSGTSKSGKTKWARGIGAGAGISKDVVGIFVDLSGEVAEQINYNRVINADLSQVRYANYLGIEGGARAGVDLVADKKITAEASVGINRQRDPEVGINQIDKNYGDLSAELFTITKFSADTVADQQSFENYLYKKIEGYKGDGKYGKFVTTNEQHLKDSADFMVRYMAANQMFGKDSILAKQSDSEKKLAFNTLLDILQSGMREQRRHDVIAGLHGKISLTKLSFGVTTNTFTWNVGKATGEPTPSGTTGETQDPGNVQGGHAGNEGGDLGQDRLGICGFYIGARISTWKNMYVPNDKQYLFTEYETGQGIGAEYIENPTKDLDTYAKYLEAVYNDKKGRLSCSVDGKKLIITFDPEKNSDLTLAKFLNIHATTAADKNFSLKGNTLIIGNVGDIAAYTITEAKGVRRILCLGTKKLDDATRVIGDNVTTTVEDIKPIENGYKQWTQEKITTTVDGMTGTGNNLDLAKSETKKFFDSEGKLTKPAGFTVTFEPASIEEGTKLTSGDLLIEKKTDGTYRVAYDITTTGKLNIIYRDMKEYEAARAEAQKNPANYETIVSTPVVDLFTFEGDMLTAKNELATLLTSIEELEDKDHQAYANFLDNVSKAEADDGIIDDEEIEKAIIHLETLIAKSTTPTTFDNLKILLKGNNYNVKAYIVDKFKQILAREPKIYIDKNIGTILGMHSGRESVKGPSDAILPADLKKEMQTKRSELKQTYAETKYSETPTVNPNLIGYTAFYRPLKQRFSITALGETGYQGELKSLSSKTLAQDRFLGNFEKNKYEVERLATSLEVKFKAQGKTVDLLKDEYGTPGGTLDTIKKLIKGEQITIDSGDKISIDVNWVFYLLGDCCNESLGMEIKNIKIQEFKDDIVVAGRYSATGDSEKIYKGGVDLYTKNHSISNRVLTQELKVGWKHHQSKKAKEPEPSGTAGEAKKEDPPPNPNVISGNNEGKNKGNIVGGSGNNE